MKTCERAHIPRGMAISAPMLGSLLVRPRQIAGESDEGHWLRVAHSNGLADPLWLLDPGHWRGLSIVRFCPQCLASQNRLWLADWSDRSRPFCSVHGRWLVDLCGGCNRLLRWNRARFLECKCGQDLRSLEAPALSFHAARIQSEESASLTVLLWLGSIARYGMTMKPLKKASRVIMSEVIELAEAGSEIVAAWPHAFFDTLSRSRQVTAGSLGLSSMNDAFPGLAGRLRKLGDASWRERITKELGAYIAASRTSGMPIVGRNAPGERPATIAQIARDLGMGSATLVAALDRLPGDCVPTRRTSQGRSRRLLSGEAVAQIQQLRTDEISSKASARILGLSFSRIRHLVEAGLLKERQHRLSREDVCGLLLSLMESGRVNPPEIDAVSVGRALRFCVPVELTAPFVRSVLDGSLAIHTPEGTTQLTSCTISQAKCRVWVARTESTEGNAMSLPVCALRLGLKQQVIYHLARVGLIAVQTVKTARGRTAMVATADSIETFKSQYVALACLAASAGVAPRWALEWAGRQGISLVSGPSIDGGRQYFARRKVLRLGASTVAPRGATCRQRRR